MAQRPMRTAEKLLLVLLVAGAAVAALWLGLVPQRYSPFAPLNLDDPSGWFLDAKLAVLRRDRALCQAVLKSPQIDASAVPDKPISNGCGWVNAVRFSQVGGAALGVDKMTCEMAGALALWAAHDLQAAAQEHLGSRVTGIDDMGTYDCRNILGNAALKNMRSQHATANAIDIGGFRLADGRRISVLKHWDDKGPEGRFLRAAHAAACRYFRVALGPDYNAAHKNHFHFDRSVFWRCK